MMKHIFEYGSFHKRGTNPNDVLGWGDQIESVIKRTLVGKEFRGYKLEKVQIKNPESFSFETDQGTGTVQLFFKKETPSDLDQLITDLAGVGLASDKVQEIGYEIDAVLDDQNMYDIGYRIFPVGSPSQRKETNFLNIFPEKKYDDSFDPSYGVGGLISGLIKDQISK